LLAGKFRYPVISVEVHITGGKFEANKLNKMVVTQACTKIVKDALQECHLLEPFVSVELIGEEEMLEHAVKDIMKKRGRVEMRENRRVLASVPAEGIRGWVKSLRAMGFDATMKFSGYEQVQGCSPELLVAAEE
jgi:translation elongation factor EF-G